MAKDNRDKGKDTFADGDTPIIVGGGNSTYVFLKTGAYTPVIPSPIPGYDCFRLADNVHVLRCADGNSPRIHAITLKPDGFGANFDLV